MIPPPHTDVERQILLNSKFELVLKVDPLDKKNKDPFQLVAEMPDLTWETVESSMPVMEILILRHNFKDDADSEEIRLNFAYIISFISDESLDAEQWERIRDCIEGHLRDYEREKFGTEGQLFYPRKRDFEESRPFYRILARFTAGGWVKREYGRIKARVEEMLKNEKINQRASAIAKEFGIEKKVLGGSLYSTANRRQPREVAERIVWEEIKRRNLGDVLRIWDIKYLRQNILSRSFGKLFPGTKKGKPPKRLLVQPKIDNPK
jgi:hypothetical protein